MVSFLLTRQRNFIRQIREAQQGLMHHLKLDLYFILGRGHHPDTKLDSEIKENRDILIGDFIDSYTNLTRKTQV